MTTTDATDDRREDEAEPDARSGKPRSQRLAGEDSEAAPALGKVVGEDTEA